MNDLATPAVNRHLWYGALLFVVCILTGGILTQLLGVQVAGVGLLVMCVSALLVASLVFIVVQVEVTTAVNSSGSIGRFLWWLLIVSEAAFVRHGSVETAAEGKHSLAAYGELAVWVAASALLVFYSVRNPRHLRGLFSGSYKWVSLYAILSVLSCSFSPQPMYSLVWAFKLCLVIILLKMLSDRMHKNDDLRAFLGATSAGIWVLVLAPFAQVLVDPELPFQEGRLGGMFAPTGVSEHAGILIVLLLTFHALERRGWLVCPIVLASTILILGGGNDLPPVFGPVIS